MEGKCYLHGIGMCGNICNMCPRSKIFLNPKEFQNHNEYHSRLEQQNVTKTTNIDIDINIYTELNNNDIH